MNFLRFIVRTTLCLGVLMSVAHADLNLEIVGGINSGRSIAVVPFAGQTENGADLSSVVTSDLSRSGTFAPESTVAFTSRASSVAEVQKSSFRPNVEAAVVGAVTKSTTRAGFYKVNYDLVSLSGAPKALLSFKAEVPKSKLRQYAHHISDQVYEKLTGVKGAFSTRIAYVRTRFGAKHPYELNIADYDGANEIKLVKSSQPIMSPTWSADGKRIAYVSFENRKAEIFVHDIYSKARTKLTSFKGLNGNPAFSPDGSKIAMVLSRDGNPEIYVLTLASKKLLRVTTNPAIDTEPSWSADGSSLYFTSERAGRPQIYKINLANGALSRVTSNPVKNFSAKAMPNGNGIVMVNQNGGFRIVHADASGKLYPLSVGPFDETPSVAPNGTMVVYSSLYGGRKQLAIVSADGRFKARLPGGSGDVSFPSWSPYLIK